MEMDLEMTVGRNPASCQLSCREAVITHRNHPDDSCNTAASGVGHGGETESETHAFTRVAPPVVHGGAHARYRIRGTNPAKKKLPWDSATVAALGARRDARSGTGTVRWYSSTVL